MQGIFDKLFTEKSKMLLFNIIILLKEKLASETYFINFVFSINSSEIVPVIKRKKQVCFSSAKTF